MNLPLKSSYSNFKQSISISREESTRNSLYETKLLEFGNIKQRHRMKVIKCEKNRVKLKALTSVIIEPITLWDKNGTIMSVALTVSTFNGKEIF